MRGVTAGRAHAHGMSSWQGVSIARVQSATVAVTAPVFTSIDSPTHHSLTKAPSYNDACIECKVEPSPSIVM